MKLNSKVFFLVFSVILSVTFSVAKQNALAEESQDKSSPKSSVKAKLKSTKSNIEKKKGSIPPKSDVYRWLDKDGVVHFSTTKPSPDAKPADLPPIMRERYPVSLNIKATCKNHGGIDCQQGKDSDGSVVCGDGFKNSVERFQLRCTGAKIKTTEIDTDKDDGSISVWVRNEKDVEAKNVSVSIPSKDSNGEKQLLEGKGPETISPMELAEYKFNNIPNKNKLTTDKVETSCSNCG